MSTTALKEVARQVRDAVVGLGRGSNGGSGVAIDSGLAITLARNVRDGECALTLAGAELRAEVAGVDRSADLAVLRFAGADSVRPLAWSSAAVETGDEVIAAADPSGGGLRTTPGTVASAPRPVRGPGGRLIDATIEHTAPMPRGAGGGPLLDLDGAVLGLNAVRQSGGLILAWPSAVLRAALERILAGGPAPAPVLGVVLYGPKHARRMRQAVGLAPIDGLMVRAVEEQSPAARAGLARGDLLLTVDGEALATPDPLYAALDDAGRGSITFEIVRGVEPMVVTVDLGDRGSRR